MFEQPTGSGSNFTAVSKDNEIKPYLKQVKKYTTTFRVASQYDGKSSRVRHQVSFGRSVYDAEPLAINNVTNEPVALAIYVGNGTLVFLPPSESPPISQVIDLAKIGERYLERNRARLLDQIEPPNWVRNYRVEEALAIEKKIGELEEEAEKRKTKLAEFHLVERLLYDYDERLEDAVAALFDDELKCDVKKMPKGYTVDYKVNASKVGKLVLEVTGDKGSIRKDNKKLTQIMSYLTSEWEREEKIVLVANTYREQDPAKRPRENFTEQVVVIARNNKFSLMTTYDLYRLWKDTLQGKPVSDVLKRIYENVGEFSY